MKMKTSKAVELRRHKGEGDGKNGSGCDRALAISNHQLPWKIKTFHSSKQTDCIFALSLGVTTANFISVFLSVYI